MNTRGVTGAGDRTAAGAGAGDGKGPGAAAGGRAPDESVGRVGRRTASAVPAGTAAGRESGTMASARTTTVTRQQTPRQQQQEHGEREGQREKQERSHVQEKRHVPGGGTGEDRTAAGETAPGEAAAGEAAAREAAAAAPGPSAGGKGPEPSPEAPVRLSGEALTLAYDKRTVSEGLSVAVPGNSFTVVVGPNACGKSTLLRALSRMLRPKQGSVLLDGADVSGIPAKRLARTLGLLPQSSVAPDGITVGDLVARGRYPHQSLLRQWSREDERVVRESMEATGVADLESRYVDELSGGQRQRVWIAMALAQQTPLLLLDEPTTYLDIAHQIEVLDLCARLHEEEGRTLVAVLHDLNHAARYATHLIVMCDGEVVAEGVPGDIVTARLVEDVFGMPCRVIDDPETGTPLVVPAARGRARAVRSG